MNTLAWRMKQAKMIRLMRERGDISAQEYSAWIDEIKRPSGAVSAIREVVLRWIRNRRS